MAYADSDDLIARYDERTVSQLASDDGDPVETLSSDAKITAALSDASGEINSAVMVSDNYTAAELAALTGDDLEFLKRITCDLAMGFLMARRPEKYADDAIENITGRACKALEMLRTGKRIFNIQSSKDAGVPDVDGPSLATYDRLNMIPDRVNNYYPGRGTRLPIGRG